jgi:hypothetical protein
MLSSPPNCCDDDTLKDECKYAAIRTAISMVDEAFT